MLHEVRSQQPRLGAVEGDNVLAAIGSVHDSSLDDGSAAAQVLIRRILCYDSIIVCGCKWA